MEHEKLISEVSKRGNKSVKYILLENKCGHKGLCYHKDLLAKAKASKCSKADKDELKKVCTDGIDYYQKKYEDILEKVAKCPVPKAVPSMFHMQCVGAGMGLEMYVDLLHVLESDNVLSLTNPDNAKALKEFCEKKINETL